MNKLNLLILILLALVVSIPASAKMTHRYNFVEDANDVVAGLETVLENGAVVQDGTLVLTGGSPGPRAVLDAAGIGINDYTDGVTLETWYSATQLGGWTRVFDFGDTNGGDGGYYFFYTPSGPGNSRLVISTGGFPGWSTGEQFINGPTLAAETVYHLVCIYDPNGGVDDDSALRIVQDGVEYANESVTMPITGVHDAFAYLGSAVYPGDPELNGIIDEFRIYDKPLSAAEIRYTAHFGPDEAKEIVLRSMSPADGYAKVNVDNPLDLSWVLEPSFTADSYNLYVGTDPNIADPNRPDVSGYATYTQTGLTSPGQTIAGGTLGYEKVYYWRVDTIIGAETYQGVGISFTTLPDSPYFDPLPPAIVIADDTDTVTITVTAGNTDTYRWYKEGDSGTTLSTTDTLTITNAEYADEGNYYCEISSSSAPSVIVTSDPIRVISRRLMGYWKFEGNLMDSVTDEVPGAPTHDGVLTVHDTIAGPGDPNYASDLGLTSIDGSNAAWFWNDGDFIEVSDSIDYFNYYHEGFTVSCWYLMDQLAGWTHPIIKLEAGNSDVSGYLFGVDGNNRQDCRFIFENALGWPGLNSDDGVSPVNYRDGNWHMMTATYDAATNTAYFYGDGVLADQGTPNFGTLGYPNATLKLGGSNLDGNASIQGGLDEVRIYSYPLSEAQVADLYTSTTPADDYICVPDTEDPLLYDLNNDCQITLSDISDLAGVWLECQRIPEDACDDSL